MKDGEVSPPKTADGKGIGNDTANGKYTNRLQRMV
jgi:hypothetical protein